MLFRSSEPVNTSFWIRIEVGVAVSDPLFVPCATTLLMMAPVLQSRPLSTTVVTELLMSKVAISVPSVLVASRYWMILKPSKLYVSSGAPPMANGLSTS